MLTVHLLRHGQTAWNVERRFLGRTDVDLDAIGEAQVAALAKVFPPVSAVFSSPLRRAWRTAEGVGHAVEGESGAERPPLRLVAESGLVEMDMGVLEGLAGPEAFASYSQLLQQFRDDPSAIVIPGGETMSETAIRMLAAWERIVRASAETDLAIAVVSHQMAMAALLCHLTGAPLREYRGFVQRNTAWTTVTVSRAAPCDPACVTLVARDQAPHLTNVG